MFVTGLNLGPQSFGGSKSSVASARPHTGALKSIEPSNLIPVAIGGYNTNLLLAFSAAITSGVKYVSFSLSTSGAREPPPFCADSQLSQSAPTAYSSAVLLKTVLAASVTANGAKSEAKTIVPSSP